MDALSAATSTLALMDATTVDPANALIRAFFADTFSDLGEAQTLLAADRAAPEGDRLEAWRTARGLCERSLQRRDDLRARGTLSAIDASKPDLAAREVARCARVLNARTASP